MLETAGAAFVAIAGAGIVGRALVGSEIEGETAFSVVLVGFCGSTSAGGRTKDVGAAVAVANRNGEGPICFKYAEKPRLSCAANNKNITAVAVNLRYFNASMRFITDSVYCRQKLPRLEERI